MNKCQSSIVLLCKYNLMLNIVFYIVDLTQDPFNNLKRRKHNGPTKSHTFFKKNYTVYTIS